MSHVHRKTAQPAAADAPWDDRGERLADVLDRALHVGVAADAEISLGVAGVPLVRISARLVAATACKLQPRRTVE
ncbi:MAG: gas vesicle protein [Pseudomonadota bacterium]